MAKAAAYPNYDIERNAGGRARNPFARIISVGIDTPAYDAGFEPGCLVTSVDGQPVRDIIDWRWLAGEERIAVGYIDLDGDAGEVELWREPGEDWGFEFEGLVFDDVKQCRNACTFCFMRQLPHGMRPSLTLRDDDFRLSFLVGTFVTLTNLAPEDEARIIEQRISPLRVSLQASDPQVRRRLIGKHAQHGLDALDRLLEAGIEFHAQIVLVPGENDGSALAETLAWAYERPGILGIGIVPLGYTRFQNAFDCSFNSAEASREVLDLIAPLQERAQAERGTPWVYAADEFYRNAYADNLLANIPPADFYDGFAMFEDGIGIIRSTIDDWHAAEASGTIQRCADALRAANATAHMVAGCAQREFLDALIRQSGIADVFRPLYVENAYFGGNVDVTGLLVAEDIEAAICKHQLGSPTGMQEGVPRAVPQGQRSPAGMREGGLVGSSPVAGRYHEPAIPQPAATGIGEKSRREDKPARDAGQPQGGQVECGSAHENPDSESAEPRPASIGAIANSEAAFPQGPRPQGLFRSADSIFLIPSVIFNDDGVTLDDQTLQDMEKATGQTLHMVSCTPAEYFEQIIAIIAG